MNRRVSLPGVDELFRSSSPRPAGRDEGQDISPQVVKAPDLPRVSRSGASAGQREAEPAVVEDPAVSGVDPAKRPRHEEKVTFYCTASDLTRIERARLALRADHKLASDRGRIVRAALAEILDDFDRHGHDSALVRRLLDGDRA